MAQQITCTSVGTHRQALTRGKQYELLDRDREKRQVRVRGDNNRTRWYGESHFDLIGAPVVFLKRWRFDEPVNDERNGGTETDNRVDVTIEFEDGSRRWCSFMTPDFLKRYLAHPGEVLRAYNFRARFAPRHRGGGTSAPGGKRRTRRAYVATG